MDPLVASGALSAGASVLGSLFSSGSSNAQIKAQREENEKNRKFNAQQAALSRQYNTQMINMQNDYNNPRNVMSRLSAAGINPALAYSNGQGVLGSVGIGSTSQQASSSGSVGTPLPDFTGLGQAGLIAAQTMKTQEEAKLAREEAYNKAVENVYADFKYMNEAAYEGAKVILTKNQSLESMEMQKKIAEETVSIGHQISLMDAQASKALSESKESQQRYWEAVETFDTRFKDLLARYNIDYNESVWSFRNFAASYFNTLSDTKLKGKQASKTTNESAVLYYDAELKRLTFDSRKAAEIAHLDADAETAFISAYINLVGDGVGALSDAINIKNIIKGRKPSKTDVYHYDTGTRHTTVNNYHQ